MTDDGGAAVGVTGGGVGKIVVVTITVEVPTEVPGWVGTTAVDAIVGLACVFVGVVVRVLTGVSVAPLPLRGAGAVGVAVGGGSPHFLTRPETYELPPHLSSQEAEDQNAPHH